MEAASLFETTFQGKPCLSDDGSFHFKETCEQHSLWTGTPCSAL